MTALSTAEAALRRAPDDPGVPVTVSGAEAAALVAELDRLREQLGEATDGRTAMSEAYDSLAADAGTVVRAWRDYRAAGETTGAQIDEAVDRLTTWVGVDDA